MIGMLLPDRTLRMSLFNLVPERMVSTAADLAAGFAERVPVYMSYWTPAASQHTQHVGAGIGNLTVPRPNPALTHISL